VIGMGINTEIRELNDKIDTLLERDSQILEKVKDVEEKEARIEKTEELEDKKEKHVEELENQELIQLKKLEDLEKEVKETVTPHPLTKVTYRDAVKGTIGAFVGIVSHFSFLEGVSHSEHMSGFRATLLLFTSFIIGVLFIYYSGFRKVKQVRIISFIPLRVTLIFFVAISVTVIVFALFGVFDSSTTFSEVYKMVATTSILAMLGAGTADLIGER
jgi:uncharacterized membrane protein